MKILYITFIDFDKSQSGSSVRPQNMYKAFLECGYEVKLLKGQQNKRKQRRKNVREIIKWLNDNTPDICYIEPPTGPFFNRIDHRLLKKLHDMGVPVGLFYRDAYWRYGLINMGKGSIPAIKEWIIKRMQIRDLKRFKKYCDIVYLTSQLAASEWEFKRIYILPPGCNIVDITDRDRKDIYAIYVGGVNKRYGTFEMLEAFKSINDEGTRVRLKLICRKKEWECCDESYRELEHLDWLDVIHIDGEALYEQYRSSDIALCPLEKDFYNDMAMPIKLMEYVSFCKPIVATNCTEMSRFINDNKVGIITEDTSEDIARGVLELAENKELRNQMIENCKTAREKHSWKQRAVQVVSELSDIKAD